MLEFIIQPSLLYLSSLCRVLPRQYRCYPTLWSTCTHSKSLSSPLTLLHVRVDQIATSFYQHDGSAEMKGMWFFFQHVGGSGYFRLGEFLEFFKKLLSPKRQQGDWQSHVSGLSPRPVLMNLCTF